MTTSLGANAIQILQMLQDSEAPLSGRKIAQHLGISPSTAAKALRSLQETKGASHVVEGRSLLWSSTSMTAAVLESYTDVSSLVRRSVVVATALPLEFAAVRKHMLGPETVRSSTGVRYIRGSVYADSIVWEVYVAQIGMGNTASAAFIAQATAEFKPDLAAFVGVAAGLKQDDQVLGDAIVGLRAYNALAGKEISTHTGDPEFLGRPESISVSKPLEQLVRSVLNGSDWDPSSPRTPLKPKGWAGSIASVESVQANPRGEVLQRIRTHLNDAIGLDMETFGAYQGAREHNLPALSVRGISDFVGDKGPDTDKTTQPRAAKNAAALFIDILRAAHAEDVPRVSAPPGVDSNPSTGRTRELPSFAKPWVNRFREDSPETAEQGIDALSTQAPHPITATWLSRTLHRPPHWLREDNTGAGWALVAQLAEAAGLNKASQAFHRAADLAESVGDAEMSFLLQLAEAQSRTRVDEDISRFVRDLNSLRIGSPETMTPLIDFYLSAADKDVSAMKVLANGALQVCGIAPSDVGLVSDNQDAAIATELDEQARNHLAVGVLLVLATAFVIETDGASAKRLASYAKSIAPTSTSADLIACQARLTILMSPASSRLIQNTSQELQAIERLALEIRSARSSWAGATDEALALAARARAQNGDPFGALKMLRPPPEGTATVIEATSATVKRIAGLAAVLTGDTKLILEFTDDAGDDADALLLRAAAFARMPGREIEADSTYRLALAATPIEDRTLLRSALLGLADSGGLFTGGDSELVSERIEVLRAEDQETAELILALNDLESGRTEPAIRRAREYPQSAISVEIQINAFVRSGRPGDAAELLENFGSARGDHTIRAQAMHLAERANLDEFASSIANDLLLDGNDEIRTRARGAKLRIAGRAQNWREVERQAKGLMTDDSAQGGDYETALRWTTIEALYFQNQFGNAIDEIMAQPALPFADRGQVQLLLACARGLNTEMGEVSPDLFDLILAVAASWIDDEQIATDSVGAILMLKVSAEPTRLQLSQVAERLEQYFAHHERAGQIKRVDVSGEDLSELSKMLESDIQPRQDALEDLILRVWLGHFPTALLGDVTSRSYAELLIKQSLGCYVVVDPSDAAGFRERKAAAKALDAQLVVIDTSALVVGQVITGRRTQALSYFEKVLFPASLRADVNAGRTALAMRSKATLGWDSALNRPTITEYDEELIAEWDRAGRELQEDMKLLSVTENPDPTNGMWDAAAELAKKLNCALWADDAGLRRAATELGVPSFSTLALLDELSSRGEEPFGSRLQVDQRLRTGRIVDIPVDGGWAERAASDNWNAAGFLGLQVSRPLAWARIELALPEYRALIRRLPLSSTPEMIAHWGANGAKGLLLATQPALRPRVVAGLLASTAITRDPCFDFAYILSDTELDTDNAGQIFRELVRVAVTLQHSYFPDGDVISEIMATLTDAMQSVIDTATTARTVVRAISFLDDTNREHAMASFLSAPFSA